MAFVLRFHEQCKPAPNGPATLGTETHTLVRAEQVDSDPGQFDLRIVPLEGVKDRCGSVAAPVPVCSGTKTVTETKQEGADSDPALKLFATF